MKKKTLHNSDDSPSTENVPDQERYGDCDRFKLLCKASSESEGWMKSTKVMAVYEADSRSPGRVLGCLVQVTTQQRNPDGSYAVAEALTFVPGAPLRSFDFPDEE